jgi:hypothetical protein
VVVAFNLNQVEREPSGGQPGLASIQIIAGRLGKISSNSPPNVLLFSDGMSLLMNNQH